MKMTHSILGLTAGAALLVASGCSKSEPPSGEPPKAMPPAASDTQKAPDAPKPAAAAANASQAVSAAASEAQKVVESPKAAPEQAPPAVAAATEQAVKAAAPSSTQIQGLIEKAKGLVTNEKYQDALQVVQQLSGFNLTAEQQKLVAGLKAQIQTALAKVAGANAASALGNVLGGKK